MVKLYAFGDPHLRGEDLASLRRLMGQTKRFALLIHLLCEDRERPHRRDELITLFWPEADSAAGRNCLRQSLFGLREALGGDVIIGNGNDELFVNPQRIQSDVAVFRHRIRAGYPDSGLRLHRAPFLSGFFLKGCPEFEGWVDRNREELRSIAVAAAMNLAHTSEGYRDLESALHWWRVAQSHAPYDERVLRRIMALLAGSGNGAKAAIEFRNFRARLEDELGMTPSQESEQLAQEITEGGFEPSRQWVGDRRARASEAELDGSPPVLGQVRRESDLPDF